MSSQFDRKSQVDKQSKLKLSNKQVHAIATKVYRHWQEQNLLTLKVSEAEVMQKLEQVIVAELEKEAELDREVHRMLDDLERTNAGEFQRYKMFPMLKQKLAKERKMIL